MTDLKRSALTGPADRFTDPQEVYNQHYSWGEKNRSLQSLIGWILLVFAVAGWVVASILSFSVGQLFPLVRTEVVPLIVDRNTGYMETVTTLDKDRSSISQLQAVQASFVGNYVIRRETYDPRYLSDNFDMIALWSEPNSRAFKDYEEWMNPSNPRGPVKVMGVTATSILRSCQSIRSTHQQWLCALKRANGDVAARSSIAGLPPCAIARLSCRQQSRPSLQSPRFRRDRIPKSAGNMPSGLTP